MKRMKMKLLGAFLLMAPHLDADAEPAKHATLKAQATQFFHRYIGTYSARLGHPERREKFLGDLSALIHTPFIMAPPSSTPPFYPGDPETLGRVFDGFVQQLERKGAVRMAWQEINLEVLTENKILANNVGLALDADGEVVYRTLSLYLLSRIKGDWKIVLFSPYDFDNKLALGPAPR